MKRIRVNTMFYKKSTLLGATVLLALTLFLTACQTSDSTTPTSPSPAITETSASTASETSEAANAVTSPKTTTALDPATSDSGLNSDETGLKAKQALIENFLQAFFTSDFEQRYSSTLNAADFTAYYQSFAALTTAACLEQLQANNEPLKYDRLAYDEGYTVKVSELKYELYADDTFAYTVSLSQDNKGEVKTLTATGQISVQIVAGKALVQSFHLSKIY